VIGVGHSACRRSSGSLFSSANGAR
jgi:hypothetical protein